MIMNAATFPLLRRLQLQIFKWIYGIMLWEHFSSNKSQPNIFRENMFHARLLTNGFNLMNIILNTLNPSPIWTHLYVVQGWVG